MKIKKRQNFSPAFLVCFLLIVPCSGIFAENEFGLRLAPIVEVPIGLSQFSAGMGAEASFDWAFLTFAKKFGLGLSLGGAFASLQVPVLGDSLALLGGKAGPFIRWRPFDRWSFDIGATVGVYQHSRKADSDTRGTFGGVLGAQFHLLPYLSLYAQGGYSYRFYDIRPLNSIEAALGMRLNLSEIMGGRARVRVDKKEQYRVFPVSWAWYEHNPVAMVQITNDEPNTIKDLNLAFFMDSFMSQPFTFASVPTLSPGESVDLPVTALFNEAMMSLTETVNANGTIQMQYRSLGARKGTVVPVQMPIFHRNTLSWDDDRRAAAFVSPRDSSARLFARYVAAAVESRPKQGNTPDNVLYAAALFEALRLYGISYVVVPATSFARVASDESVLDNVSYPYQALYYRGGDCSYLSILFCSMLEALNIESAFITIPGHIYIAFNTGDAAWQAGNRNIIEIDGKRWLPVEITVPEEGFSRAWYIGARQWQSNGGDAALYPIREAWETYPSVTVPSSGAHLPEMPDWDDILRALNTEQQKMR